MSQIDYSAIGERLRAYRIGRQLSANQIAKQLGISRAAVYRLEHGIVVKLDTLDRLAHLLKVPINSLLGSETEYFDNSLGYFERMHQLEAKSTKVVSYFDPFSYLLTSDQYFDYFLRMLQEARPQHFPVEAQVIQKKTLDILYRRKETFTKINFEINSIVSIRQIERFLHIGLVGRLDLPASTRMERALQARREVEHLICQIEQNPHLNIYLVDELLPNLTFQIFYQPTASYVAVSPYRLGELPNIHCGIASVTSSTEAVDMHKHMANELIARSVSGEEARQQILRLLAKL
ncbi:helix-turn-helix domain-containing protein [Zymobacter sp. IVIA_5232.4 C2]|uniref:helix-turn-helix domain-containing protein n=1 Tax=Zymobacter sp. IVIA_5232.4 C2 TaxID=3394855 RepID=UPI0039C18DFC